MAKYTPKSKINIQEAGPGEFIIKKTRKPYIGSYIETSTGQYYAGKDSRNLEIRIIKPPSLPNSFGRNKNTHKYNILNKLTYGLLKKTKNIVSSKNIPTEDDYKSGKYTRYFIKKANDLYGYFEVNKDIYASIKDEKKEYNHPLYEIGVIVWSLVGNVKKINKAQIFLLRNQFPNLNVLFSKLDEFKKTEERTIENLFTEGGELYYKDGKEYKGKYHIHSGKGPMVGSKHISEPHEMLYYEQPKDTIQTGGDIILGKPVTSLAEIAPEYTILSPTISNPPITPSAPSTGGGSSGGGGGGY